MDTNTDTPKAKELPGPIEEKKTDWSERQALPTKKQKSWRDMSPAQKIASAILLTAELALTGWAAWDLRKRPSADINGKKRTWVMAFFVQPFGPVSYLVFGHKRGKSLIGA
jgi:hypothetical protein